MGTPEFAVASLDVLVKNNYSIVGVVTAPDKPAGRGQHIQESPVKKYAVKNNLLVLQPEKLKDPQFVETLKTLSADIQIVVAFRMLPEIVWSMPKLGTFNLHASLLPKYRGAAPINHAIINGDTRTGVTTFKLQHQIDSGNILFQKSTTIGENTTAGELHDELMQLGANLILETARVLEQSLKSGIAPLYTKQNESEISHAPKIFRENCKIDWTRPVKEIFNLIRGLSPHPAAFGLLSVNNEQTYNIKIYKAIYVEGSHINTNGLLVTDKKKYLKVYCSGGFISIIELQAEGKKRMGIEDFLKGFRIPEGAKFL